MTYTQEQRTADYEAYRRYVKTVFANGIDFSDTSIDLFPEVSRMFILDRISHNQPLATSEVEMLLVNGHTEEMILLAGNDWVTDPHHFAVLRETIEREIEDGLRPPDVDFRVISRSHLSTR